jgi:hypothetical protein
VAAASVAAAARKAHSVAAAVTVAVAARKAHSAAAAVTVAVAASVVVAGVTGTGSCWPAPCLTA